MTSIGDRVFYNCTALSTAVIGNGVRIIPSELFYGCNHMTNLTLGSGVQSIAVDAFSGCNAVLRLTCLAQVPPTATDNPFTDFNTNIPVYVPCNSLEAYRNAAYWGFFSNLQCNTEDIEDVDDTDINIYSEDGHIRVNGAEGMTVSIYDMMGRKVFHSTYADKTPTLPAGIYLVKVDDYPSQKVVVR